MIKHKLFDVSSKVHVITIGLVPAESIHTPRRMTQICLFGCDLIDTVDRRLERSSLRASLFQLVGPCY